MTDPGDDLSREQPASPYIGVQPFALNEAALLTGRRTETDVLQANLRASRLTLVYGDSGVGKTSLIQAGVRPALDKLAAQRRKAGEPAGFAVAVFRHWSADPIEGLGRTLHQAVRATLDRDLKALDAGPHGGTWAPPWGESERPEQLAAPGSAPFRELCRNWARHVGRLLIVLDQFEDVIEHARPADNGGFVAQFAETVNDPGTHAHVLISIRADGLAELDRFKGSIPGLFRNYLRIEALSRRGGREAIREPLATYGEWIGRRLAVDEDVVTAVLDAVTVPASGSGDDRRIEASLLQLVMQRLWVAGRDESDRLQASTLQRLRGPEHIIDGYVDGIIDDLPPSDRGVAESVLSRLVTGSGFRTALPAVDLVGTSSGTHDAVMSVLKQLSSGDVRLLHRFPQPDNPTQQLYEVSHDKLADAIVKRRERLRREAATRRRKRLAAPLTWAIAVAVVATTVALSAYAAERVDWHDVFLGGLVVAAASWIVAAALWFRSRKTGPPA